MRISSLCFTDPPNARISVVDGLLRICGREIPDKSFTQTQWRFSWVFVDYEHEMDRYLFCTPVIAVPQLDNARRTQT